MENDIKWLVYGSLISADNDNYTEEQKQESIHRYELSKSAVKEGEDLDWNFILEPFEDTDSINKLVDLFK